MLSQRSSAFLFLGDFGKASGKIRKCCQRIECKIYGAAVVHGLASFGNDCSMRPLRGRLYGPLNAVRSCRSNSASDSVYCTYTGEYINHPMSLSLKSSMSLFVTLCEGLIIDNYSATGHCFQPEQNHSSWRYGKCDLTQDLERLRVEPEWFPVCASLASRVSHSFHNQLDRPGYRVTRATY